MTVSEIAVPTLSPPSVDVTCPPSQPGISISTGNNEKAVVDMMEGCGKKEKDGFCPGPRQFFKRLAKIGSNRELSSNSNHKDSGEPLLGPFPVKKNRGSIVKSPPTPTGRKVTRKTGEWESPANVFVSPANSKPGHKTKKKSPSQAAAAMMPIKVKPPTYVCFDSKRERKQKQQIHPQPLSEGGAQTSDANLDNSHTGMTARLDESFNTNEEGGATGDFKVVVSKEDLENLEDVQHIWSSSDDDAKSETSSVSSTSIRDQMERYLFSGGHGSDEKKDKKATTAISPPPKEVISQEFTVQKPGPGTAPTENFSDTPIPALASRTASERSFTYEELRRPVAATTAVDKRHNSVPCISFNPHELQGNPSGTPSPVTPHTAISRPSFIDSSYNPHHQEPGSATPSSRTLSTTKADSAITDKAVPYSPRTRNANLRSTKKSPPPLLEGSTRRSSMDNSTRHNRGSMLLDNKSRHSSTSALMDNSTRHNLHGLDISTRHSSLSSESSHSHRELELSRDRESAPEISRPGQRRSLERPAKAIHSGGGARDDDYYGGARRQHDDYYNDSSGRSTRRGDFHHYQSSSTNNLKKMPPSTRGAHFSLTNSRNDSEYSYCNASSPTVMDRYHNTSNNKGLQVKEAALIQRSKTRQWQLQALNEQGRDWFPMPKESQSSRHANSYHGTTTQGQRSSDRAHGSSSHSERHTSSPKHRSKNNDPRSRWVEVYPGVSVPLRTAKETEEAIGADFYISICCCGCQKDTFCILDASYVVCPYCKFISPLEGNNHGRRFGLGIGFTGKTLCEIKQKINDAQDAYYDNRY